MCLSDLQQLSSNYSFDPLPLIPSYKLPVPTDGSVEIFCERPAGLPTPKVWWEGPNGKVIPVYSSQDQDETRRRNNKGTAFTSADSGTLFLQNVKTDQTGNYTCVGENIDGFTRASFQLVVTSKNTQNEVDDWNTLARLKYLHSVCMKPSRISPPSLIFPIIIKHY